MLDFVGDESWSSISEPYWLTSGWKNTKYSNSIVLSVPMLPKSPSDCSLSDGAQGKYNKYFKTLAEHLVKMGMSKTIIRPGWEMNGNWYKWSAANGNEKTYAEYFANIVTAMRSVSGAEFKFLWNPALGEQSADVLSCYPGNEFVDFVGLDVYDESWAANTYPIPQNASESEIGQRRTNAWDSLLTRKYGLNWLSEFAQANGKQIIIGEWGLNIRSDGHGGGDNAAFVGRMHDWLEANNDIIFAHIYFDVTAPDGDHAISGRTNFQNAADEFKRLWGPEGSGMEIITPGESGAEISVSEISVNSAKKTVTVKGQLSDSQPAACITVKILKPDSELNKISASGLINAGEAITDAEGGFVYTFKMPDNAEPTDSTKKYSVYLDGNGYLTAVQQFGYADSNAVAAALAALRNASSAAEVKSLLKENENILINMPLYYRKDITDDKVLGAAAEMLYAARSTAFADENAFGTALSNALVINSLRYAQSIDGFLYVLENYNDIIGLDYSDKTYSGSIISDKSKIFKNMYDKRNGISTYANAQSMFLQNVFSEAINQGKRSDINSVIRDMKAFVMAQKPGARTSVNGYLAAKSEDRAYIDMELYKAVPADFDKLIGVLESAYADISRQNTNKQPTGGGSSGGTGGKGSSSGLTYNQNPAADESTETFSDLDSVGWARTEINALAEKGIVNGYDGKFNPQNLVTRSEFIKMIVMSFDLYDSSAELVYTDAKAHWSDKYVASAHKHGIINGISETEFGCDMPITRQDMTVIAERAAKRFTTISAGGERTFADSSEVSDYAADAVKFAASSGIMNGYEDNTFRPKNNAARAEAAMVIYSLISRK